MLLLAATWELKNYFPMSLSIKITNSLETTTVRSQTKASTDVNIQVLCHQRVGCQ